MVVMKKGCIVFNIIVIFCFFLGEVRIVFLIYKSLNEFMSPVKDLNESEDFIAIEDTAEPMSNKTEPFINTNVFSASVNGRKTKLQLSKPIVYTLKHLQVMGQCEL